VGQQDLLTPPALRETLESPASSSTRRCFHTPLPHHVDGQDLDVVSTESGARPCRLRCDVRGSLLQAMVDDSDRQGHVRVPGRPDGRRHQS
jgi:hypothetical protein